MATAQTLRAGLKENPGSPAKSDLACVSWGFRCAAVSAVDSAVFPRVRERFPSVAGFPRAPHRGSRHLPGVREGTGWEIF